MSPDVLYAFYWQQRFLILIIKLYQHKALSEGNILYFHHFWLWHMSYAILRRVLGVTDEF